MEDKEILVQVLDYCEIAIDEYIFNSLSYLKEKEGDFRYKTLRFSFSEGNLEWLDLSGLQVKHVSSDIDKLAKIKYLNLSDNLLTSIPIGINHLREVPPLVFHNLQYF